MEFLLLHRHLVLLKSILRNKAFIFIFVFITFYLWLPHRSSAQVLAQDSLALVALYQSTGGDQWTNNTNWLKPGQPVSTWYGIRLMDDRVWEVGLNANNLIGSLPEKISDLTGLYTLVVGQNHLSGTIPLSMSNMHRMFFLDLSANDYEGNLPSHLFNIPLPSGVGGTPRVLSFFDNNFSGIAPWNGVFEYVRDLTLEYNQLDFADLETIIPNTILDFSYSPQLPIYTENEITVFENSGLTIKTVTGGSVNHYQWFKDGIPVSGATQTEYTRWIKSVDEGTYTAEITNDIVSDLTLERNPLAVHVKEDTIYTSCNGTSILLNAAVSDAQATYRWSTGATTSTLSVNETGKYIVQVETSNYILKDTMEVVVYPKLSLGPDVDTCNPTASISSNIPDAETYIWETPSGVVNNEVTVSAQVNGRYILEIISGECIQKDTLEVILNHPAEGDFEMTTGSQEIPDNGIALAGGELQFINTSIHAHALDWSFGDGSTSTLADPTHTFKSSGQYTITLNGEDHRNCPFTVEKNIEVQNILITNAISPNGDGKNDQLFIEPFIYTAELRVVNRWGQEVYQSTDYQNDFTGSSLETGVYYYELRFTEIDKSFHGNIHIIK